MAARAYWKGSLKLSLVSCPVSLYPASTAVEKTRFHLINRETGNRLKPQMVDPERRTAPRPGIARRVSHHCEERGNPETDRRRMLHLGEFRRLLAMTANLSLRLALLCALLRHLRASLARFGQTDRNRLLAAFDLPSRAAAPQRSCLAFLHRATDFCGGRLRISSCHDHSPGCCRKTIIATCGSSVLIRRSQAIADYGFGQHELRALGIDLDLLAKLAHIDPQILRVGELIP